MDASEEDVMREVEARRRDPAYQDDKARANLKDPEVRITYEAMAERVAARSIRMRCVELATQSHLSYKRGSSILPFADQIFRYVTTGELDPPMEAE